MFLYLFPEPIWSGKNKWFKYKGPRLDTKTKKTNPGPFKAKMLLFGPDSGQYDGSPDLHEALQIKNL